MQSAWPSVFLFLSSFELIHHVVGLINLADVPCGKLGLRGPRFGRIVGGSVASFGEFPWMVSIKYKHGAHFCGGTIIHKQFILSAAHCFNSLKNRFTRLDSIKVTVGEYSQMDEEVPENALDFNITQVIFHPHFQESSNANDIALIRLSSSINWSATAQPLCLSEREDSYPGTGVIAGWGRTKENGGQWSDKIQQAKISILENPLCQLRFKLALVRFNLSDLQICAGELFGGKDACQGDSGGPLMIQTYGDDEEEQMSALGIVSMGKGCGRIGLPGIYTRVPKYVPWIKDRLIQTLA